MLDEWGGTVYLVDDDPVVRSSLGQLLSLANYPTETYPSAKAVLEVLSPASAGCLVLDMSMPDISGLELMSMLTERYIDLPTIVLTGSPDVRSAVNAMKAGAFDYLEKPIDGSKLLDSVHRALTFNARDRVTHMPRTRFAERYDRLSPREREVFQKVADGKSTREIAEQLKLSIKTVESHRANLMRKMVARNVANLIEMALVLEGAVQAQVR